jgi:hypothetical protein
MSSWGGFCFMRLCTKASHPNRLTDNQQKRRTEVRLYRLPAIENYSNTTITTRRFSALPFFVLFGAAGRVSP